MIKSKKHLRFIFIASIITLIVNDLFLKSYFSNYITGKLSDVAGLFAFPYFLSILFPKKIKYNYIGTALFFIFWKTEFIEPLLKFLQDIGIGINRTIDYSDLYTLAILPISYLYLKSNINDYFSNRFFFKPIIIAISIFAFIATSMPKKYKNLNLKSNLEISLKADEKYAISKLNLNRIYDSIQYYNYTFKLEESNTKITTKIKIAKLDDGLISIKLDSILKSETRGNLFFGVNSENLEYINKLTTKDYERFFIEKGIIKLYENN